MSIFSYSLQGKRPVQEDNHITFLNLNNNDQNSNQINFFAVFDGHGGKRVSKFLKDNLPSFFINKLEKNIFSNKNTTVKYINSVYDLLQNKLKNEHPKAVEYCGSTACVVINTIENEKNVLWVINVGDSRAILCNKLGQCQQLSLDHKPNTITEKKRIESLGGKIKFDGYEWRIKTLSLSRAFGDLDCSPFVTHIPEINRYKIDPKDKFLIIACDGLFESITNNKAIEFIRDLQFKNFTGNYAKELAQYALLKGSGDNITVIIYFFN